MPIPRFVDAIISMDLTAEIRHVTIAVACRENVCPCVVAKREGYLVQPHTCWDWAEIRKDHAATTSNQ